MNRKMKQYFASLTAAFMLMGLLPVNAYAEDRKAVEVIVEELSESSRLQELSTKPHEVLTEKIYSDDEMVNVIVEMEESPVMEYFQRSTYSMNVDKTPGEAVAEFLSSPDAKAASEELIKNQQNVVSQISNLLNKDDKAKLSATEEFQVLESWSTLVNGMAIRIPYGKLKEIKQLQGVKRAYVEHVYDEPEPIKNSIVEDGKGVYEYSYDMAGIQEAWQKGYTGKEMLVAVIDSGIDVKMDWTQKVVREHEAFTDNSFKSGNPTDGVNDWDLRYTAETVNEFMKNNQINSNTGTNGNKLPYENNVAYKNLKVPYGWDYADEDFNVLNPNSDHGTHVAGTIAGFASTEEGEVKFSGVSPDAQILFMKVFPNAGGGAPEIVIINALEDSLKLGADLINLSLGSSNGFADDDTFQNDVYRLLSKAGIIMMTSAGNDYKSIDGNNYNSSSITSNPDDSMISSPSVYDSNLSVASMENNINLVPYLNWKDNNGVDHKVYFRDPWTVAMKADFSDKEYPIYKVNGAGTYSDYYNAGFNNGYNNGKTGLALVKRGEISFKDKINNALYFAGKNSQGVPYGVLGVIVYDDNPESTELINMSVEGTALDSAFISGKDGAEIVKAIESGYQVKIKVSNEDETIDSPSAGQMSSFTSWGAGPGLELKPEITAPGGNIWSSVMDKVNIADEGYTGSYEMMSGTSMAAPHMSGIGALVRERVLKESAFNGLASEEIADVISQFLVSTAVPKKDLNGVYYSPRQQGAGLVNAAAAISTPAYISVEGEKVGKLELGDDAEKTGNLNIAFNLNNISSNTVKYNAEVVLMRPGTDKVDSKWGERNTITDSNLVIKTLNLGEISATAKGTTNFNKVVSLSEDEKAELDKLFENGTFVEGYVVLTDATGNGNPQLGLPILSFYGDWTKAPIFDSSLWIDEPTDGESVLENESTWNTSVVGSYLINDIYGIIGFFNLGQNIFDGASVTSQMKYEKENITLSPNDDGYFDRIDDYVLYQIRDAKVIVIEAKDAETGEVYMRQWTPYSQKSLYNGGVGAPIPFSIYGTYPTWDGTDMEGNILPSGTKCVYTITAYGEGEYGDKVFNEDAGKEVTDFDSIIPGENEPTFNGHEMDKTGDVISFPVTIDTEAPMLQNNAVTIYEKDGRTYITGKVMDEDGSLASVEIAPQITRSYKEGYGDPSYKETGMDKNNLFYLNNIYDPATKELTFTADVTEYVHENESYPGENYYYNFEWTGNVIISCGDYGANDRSYAMKIDATEGIVLSQTSAILYPGSKFNLSVNNNTTDTEAVLTRTSSNPSVATIDETGLIEAIAPGQTVITVSNGVSSAICVVAVQERNDELKDFKLSIDSFSGLKKDCQAVVKVTDVQPANANIKNITWEIIEEQDYVDKYGPGTVGIARYSSDGLAGYVFTNPDYEYPVLPAGEATVRVTMDGIVREMKVGFDEVHYDYNYDYITSNESYDGQIIYMKQGEETVLKAKYKQFSKHQVGTIETELTGLKLDGADFYFAGAPYKGKLVNEEGYGLPASIKLYTVYSDGSRSEYINYPYYSTYSYNPATGEFGVNYAPYGSDSKLLIVAEGVVSEGAPAGTVSDTTYDRPDGLFGPFDWTLTSGDGEMTVGPVEVNGSKFESATFKPSKPGVSYITASSKDGKHSINFAVVAEPILADTINLDTRKLEIKTGEAVNLNATLSPIPTLDKDKDLVWKSFNPEVATVSEDGTITGVSAGYAYIKVESATNCKVTSYCIVQVTKTINKYEVIFKDYDGTVLKEETVEEGNSAVAPADPVREGYEFTGWDVDFTNVSENLVVTAQYEKIINKYNVTFKDYDGTVLKEEAVEEGNSAVAPADPVRPGYSFIGWDLDFSKVTEDLVITAQYSKGINKYTVTFKDYDGTVLKEEVVEQGKAATAPIAPVRNGYKFEGWDTAFDNITKDLVVTAKYSKVDSNGGSENNDLPQTGGKNRTAPIVASVLLCTAGVLMLKKRNKQRS